MNILKTRNLLIGYNDEAILPPVNVALNDEFSGLQA